MNYEITGTIIHIFPEVQVSDRFKKREFVIEKSENNFVEQIKFQTTQDKTSILDSFKIGDNVKLTFNIRGSKWKDNWFVNLQAWRIDYEKVSDGTGPVSAPPPGFNEMPPLTEEDGDELPF